jgi:hypothetical protein
MRIVTLAMIACLAVSTAARPLDLVGTAPGSIEDAAVAGARIFCAAGNGLLVLSERSGADPVQIAFLPLAGAVHAVDTDGSLAILAAHHAGLHVVDVSDPAHPIWLSTCSGPQYGCSVVLANGLAYVADEFSGLWVIDLADPTHPVVAGSLAVPGNPQDLAHNGNLVFVAAQTAGLRIIDVSNPAQPVEIGQTATAGSCAGVAVDSPYAYVCASGYRLHVIDIATPTAPVTIGSFQSSDWGYAYDIAVSGERAYLATSAGLCAVDIAQPESPVPIGTADLTGYHRHVTVCGGTAWVSSTFGGLHGVDRDELTVTAHYRSLGMVGQAIQHTDGRVLVLGGYRCDEKGEREGMAGLYEVGLADPAAPVAEAFYALEQQAAAMDVAGDLAVVFDYYGKLFTLDVSKPGATRLLGACQLTMSGRAVQIVGDLAYLASSEGGLRIADISDPAAPHEIGHLATAEGASDVVVNGTVAYVTNGYDRLYVIDVADPQAPVVLGLAFTPNYAHAVAVAGGLAYVAAGNSGLLVLDVSDGASPVLVATIDTPGQAYDVDLRFNRLWVADGAGGVHLFSLTEPAAPYLVSTWTTPASTQPQYVRDEGSLVLVSCGTAGLYLLSGAVATAVENPPPAAPAMISIAPNPCNPGTTIAFTLAAPDHVTLRIYDIAGLAVRTLLAGEIRGGGRHALAWNGRNDEGREMPSGIYIGRLVTSEGVQSRKIALVR